MIQRTGVYAIRNKVSGKQYVGGAYKSLESRRKRHWQELKSDQHFNPHLQNAWNRYGENAFEFIVLERCSPEMCEEREQHWINRLDATNPKYGYNICPIAGSRLGVDEQGRHREKRAKAGRACRGSKWSEESKKEWSDKQKGKTLSEEHKSKIQESTKATCSTPEVRKKRSEDGRRFWNGAEEGTGVKRVSAAIEAAKQPEVRAKASISIRKALACRSPEELALWKLRLSIAAKKRIRKR